MVEAQSAPGGGMSPTFQATSANTRMNPVPSGNNYGNEFEQYLVSALNDSLIRKSRYHLHSDKPKCEQQDKKRESAVLDIFLLLTVVPISIRTYRLAVSSSKSSFLLSYLQSFSFFSVQIKSRACSSLPGGLRTERRTTS